MTLTAYISGIGVLGPGLADWSSGQQALREPATWQHAHTVVPAPQRLPATERRRAGNVVKASIVVADQALAMAAACSGLDAATLPTVFTSSTGDPLNCHQLCEALALPERMVSPTKFTNSVHNAPAGYWHIAAQSRAPSTSLAAFDASFAAGLQEAAVQCVATGAPVLLVACDVPYPEPLHALRPLSDVFAVALVLAPAGPGRALTLEVSGNDTPTTCSLAGLEGVRTSIPAARALPLLQALSQAEATCVVVDGLSSQHLRLSVAAA
jgi:hypothetical protein